MVSWSIIFLPPPFWYLHGYSTNILTESNISVNSKVYECVVYHYEVYAGQSLKYMNLEGIIVK